MTAFVIAVGSGHLPVVEFLVNAGVDVNTIAVRDDMVSSSSTLSAYCSSDSYFKTLISYLFN